MMRAAYSAIHDFSADIRRCVAAADKIEPNLRYAIDLRFDGHPVVGTAVESVELKRIGKSGQPLETSAEKCVAELLINIELPPSAGRSQMMMVFRYDGCTPKYDIGRTDAQTYARAFPKWLAAHSDEACPSKLDELLPFTAYKVPGVDPWGHPYRWRCSSDVDGRPIEITSAGRDGKDGTEDDVTSWR